MSYPPRDGIDFAFVGIGDEPIGCDLAMIAEDVEQIALTLARGRALSPTVRG